MTADSGELQREEAPGHSEPAGASDLATQWARIRARLQAEVGEVEYRTWLRQMTLGALDGDEVTVHLPTRFLRDWVRSHYGDRLNKFWQQENRRVRRVDIRVGRGTLAGGTAENGLAHDLTESADDAYPSAFAGMPR
ncbi:DnaA N-terminal domain-containing protein, partial [Acidisphaera rubrifaciens]|uniref:DnaA N-terminal domain-containing protein n=1 Tax=Acidisphaera rubrifaciens TaxID=50715 RepID=UPI0035A24FFF